VVVVGVTKLQMLFTAGGGIQVGSADGRWVKKMCSGVEGWSVVGVCLGVICLCYGSERVLGIVVCIGGEVGLEVRSGVNGHFVYTAFKCSNHLVKVNWSLVC